MNRAIRAWMLSPVLAAALLSGVACESQQASAVEVEKLPDIKPSLPAVPTLPPPPHPIQYSDNSYSLFGLRKKLRTTMDTEVEVTGYVVETYVPPECPEGKTCPLARAPHVYVADTKDEKDRTKQILLVGYAENQKTIDEAIADVKRGKYKPPPPDSGLLPVPTDLFPGAKIRAKAQFTRVSGSGFAQSDGLLDYRGHVTLEPPAVIPEPAVAESGGKKKKRR
jgi:hypothetical protein